MPLTRDHTFSAALGGRIRYARIAAKLSQSSLADRLGITFQQVQKYELGKNGVSAEMLVKIAAALDRSTTELLDDQPGIAPVDRPATGAGLRAAVAIERLEPQVQRHILRLIEALPPAQPEAEAA